MNRRVFFAAAPVAAAFAAEGMAAGGGENVTATGPKTPLFPDDAQFWFETVRAFGAAEYGGSLFGEVLTISSRIKAGDYDSWYEAWNA